MRLSTRVGVCLILAAALAPASASAKVVASWVELVSAGTAEVRVATTDAACPSAKIDGNAVAMTVRAAATPSPANVSFPLTCALTLPAGIKKLSVDGNKLPVPSADPQRILVLGDTGCRIKRKNATEVTVQNCNKPSKWPFAGLAAAAAALKPDLVIHVGDYIYRESACPTADAKKCGGSPFGDNWATWKADFFKPAAPLLAAAPWVTIRGNHEDCEREGQGYVRLLAVVAYGSGACIDHLPVYEVSVGTQPLAVMDTATGNDSPADPAVVALFQKDYADIKNIATSAGQPVWIATHRPSWGVVSPTVGGNQNLIQAAGDLSAFSAVSLLLAGHIHAFEALNYDAKLPPQIVAGHGGDKLDTKMPASFDGMVVPTTGMTVKTGLSVGGFGFLTMKRDGAGWSIRLYDSAGKKGMKCALQSGVLSCPAPN